MRKLWLVLTLLLCITCVANSGVITFKQGNDANVPSTFKYGEPAFTKDTKRFFIGYSSGKQEFAHSTFVTPEMYGAKGDGTTDDTAAIQTSIDVASTAKIPLVFSSKTYIVNTVANSATYPVNSYYAFAMRNNMMLKGTGQTILKVKDSCTTPSVPKWYQMFLSNEQLSNITIDGIIFDGNYLNNKSTKYQTVTAIDYTTNNTLTITGHGLTTGTIVLMTTTGTLPSPLVDNSSYYVINDTVNTIKLATSADNATNNIAVDLTNAGSGTLTVFKYSRYNQSFIMFADADAKGDDIRITNNVFRYNGGVNNIICGLYTNTVDIPLGSNWYIANNTMYDNGMDSNDHTSVYGYANNVTVTNNYFYQTSNPVQFNMPGARCAYEVHGKNATFSNNIVRNYNSGVYVNTNWHISEAVDNINVIGNKLYNMGLSGIRLWRESGQALLSKVLITNNFVELSETFYKSGVVKAGIYGDSNSFSYSINDITVDNNYFTAKPSMTNRSAGLSLIAGGISNELMDRFTISNNKVNGTYYGIYLTTSSGTLFGTVNIVNNELRNLKNAESNTNAMGIYIKGYTGYPLKNVIIDSNIIEDTNGSPETKYGVYLEQEITKLTTLNNKFYGVVTANWVNATASISSRVSPDYLPEFGIDVTSITGNTLVPTGKNFKVTVTTSTNLIAIPFASWIGSITVMPTTTWTLATGGTLSGVNYPIAKSTTCVANQAITLTFNGTSWYPSY